MKKNNYTNPLLKICSIIYFIVILFAIAAKAQPKNIKNDIFWNTQEGTPIYSQGGGIFRFPDAVTGKTKYYWYGVNYVEAETYRNNPAVTLPNATFKSVTCYSSTDLVNWKFEADVLTKEEVNKTRKTWVGRLGVAYIKTLKKYAMFVQHGNKELITVSDSPTGEFKVYSEFSMESRIGTSNTGDQTVFTDEDNGKSYLVYSYGSGRNKIYISEIGVQDGKIDLLDCIQIFKGESREGNCMFKYNKKYYMCASNIYGWDASYAYYLVADNIKGPYKPANDMKIMDGCADDFAHVTQTGFFFNVKGTEKETVIYCGDRWANFAGNGLGYNQWFPLSFTGNTPYFNSLSSWNLDAATGKWNVAADNNFVKNGSFEADRRHIPSHVKPVQAQLTGWATQVIKGNAVSLDSSSSPVLNYFNTENDRKNVVGEKSLHISDQVDFQHKIFQTITSSPFVKLEDGIYTLTAKIKNTAGFIQLEMYAEAAGKKVSYSVATANEIWTTISVPNITVRGGKLEIGFLATGSVKSDCQVDDVVLIKNIKK